MIRRRRRGLNGKSGLQGEDPTATPQNFRQQDLPVGHGHPDAGQFHLLYDSATDTPRRSWTESVRYSGCRFHYFVLVGVYPQYGSALVLGVLVSTDVCNPPPPPFRQLLYGLRHARTLTCLHASMHTCAGAIPLTSSILWSLSSPRSRSFRFWTCASSVPCGFSAHSASYGFSRAWGAHVRSSLPYPLP